MAIGEFYLSPALSNGDRDTGTVITLDPHPSYVRYGPRLILTKHETEGKVIAQRSANNPSVREWVWENYRPTVPKYTTQYETLFRHQQHIREDTYGESPYVYLKETVTNLFGIYHSGTGSIDPDWIRCRILNVDRTLREDGGFIKYPKTTVEFTIDDPNYTVV